MVRDGSSHLSEHNPALSGPTRRTGSTYRQGVQPALLDDLLAFAEHFGISLYPWQREAFGAARFPGVQGALFLDYGRAWSDETNRRGVLGSGGLGLRMPIGPPLVLRLDIGWRLGSSETQSYGLPSSTRHRHFVDFFFGYNY